MEPIHLAELALDDLEALFAEVGNCLRQLADAVRRGHDAERNLAEARRLERLVTAELARRVALTHEIADATC